MLGEGDWLKEHVLDPWYWRVVWTLGLLSLRIWLSAPLRDETKASYNESRAPP